jgi:hypothetical protein
LHHWEVIMEQAAVTGVVAGFPGKVPLARTSVLALATCVLAPAGLAQQPEPPITEGRVASEARTDQPQVRVELRTTTLPRLEAQDAGGQAQRVDLSLMPANSGGVGAVVGLSGYGGGASPLGLQTQRTSLDIGLRWSHTLRSQEQLDITAFRRMNNSPDDAYTLTQMRDPVYGARVELNLAGKKNRLGFDRGLFGLQLESGARISIRRKDGGPMVYYRSNF